MTTLSHSGSAKVLQFPKRGRFSAADRRLPTKPLAHLDAPLVPVVDWDGWYHQAAIDETARPRRR